MMEIEFKLKAGEDAKKNRYTQNEQIQQFSPVSAAKKKKLSIKTLIVVGLIGLVGYNGYNFHRQKIKPIIEKIEAVEDVLKDIREFEFRVFFDIIGDKTKKTKQKNKQSLSHLNINGEQPPKGSYVAGYEVTSPRGWRIHPITKAQKFHNGSDLATPIGTPIYAVADGKNECFNQPGLAGIYSVFTFDGGKYRVRHFHLNNCNPGNYKVGQKIAETGNTGGSTGPHLHIESQILVNGDWESRDPSRKLIQFSLKPFSATPGQQSSAKYDGTKVALKGLSPNIAAFLDTIAYAEGTLRPDGYEITYGYEQITNFDKHPDRVICRKYNGRDLCSSAAGRYQFLTTTWNEYAQPDFTSESQDRAAIALLKAKGILPLIEKGNIALAIQKSGSTWASFPHNNYGQRQLSLKKLLNVYQERKKTYE
jgi:muramidase (phage lysozyme)/murein DD-endopeptidase MepM/ murein hydrolase activator NlpD